jgi:hypothetical protein
MKIKLATLALSLGILTLSSCKKKEVADETITYEVFVTNAARNSTIEYTNESGGKDLAVLTTGSFSKSYTIKSNASKITYGISLSCYSKYVTGSSTTFQPQDVTINIKEDDKVVKTISKSGSSDIYISSSEINASLPSATKYK